MSKDLIRGLLHDYGVSDEIIAEIAEVSSHLGQNHLMESVLFLYDQGCISFFQLISLRRVSRPSRV